MKTSELLTREQNPHRGLLACEWVAMGYLVLTALLMAAWWSRLVDPGAMVKGRLQYVVITLAMWGVYWLRPCRLTMFLRVLAQMLFLSFWYPDTYELNRLQPNLDHVFATAEQQVFGCQPALLFARQVPYGWMSELMCLGYVSYYPLILLVYVYYFLHRYDEFRLSALVILGSFFACYVVYILLPVTGPQFYYLAVGLERIAQGTFPDVGNWFLTHSERMAAPGWTDGFWYHMLRLAHDAGERPTAAFPSSHVAVTTVVVLMALRTRCRWLVATVLPFYVLLCLSTVYIMAHYVIDAVAGLLTGCALCALLLRAGRRERRG